MAPPRSAKLEPVANSVLAALPPRTYRDLLGGLEPVALAFGDLGQLKARFAEAGARLFGCGWVWLARAQQDGALRLYSTAEHETPATQGNYPILVNDLWEHAYYLKHENRCDDYLAGWWAVVNWKEAARRFEHGDPVGRRWVTDLADPCVAAA